LLWTLEREWHLPDEQALRGWLLARWPGTIRASNGYDAGMHFPVTFAVLAWLYWCRPVHCPWIRCALLSATVVGLAVHFAFPLAPPRMLADRGFVDTGLAFGQSGYRPPGANSLAHQYATMPSLHVGWALLVAVAVGAAVVGTALVVHRRSGQPAPACDLAESADEHGVPGRLERVG